MLLTSVERLIGVGAAIGILPVAFVGYALAANRCSARERDAAIPGDEMIPKPMFATTQAVTIAEETAGRAGPALGTAVFPHLE